MTSTTTPRQATAPSEQPGQARAGGWLILAYALACYAVFLAVLVYSAGFFADLGVPLGVDAAPRSGWPAAVAADLGLLLLFAVQHTVMARPWFKRRWTRLIPPAAERATFVLAASGSLALLCWLWQPVGTPFWHLSGPAETAVLAVYFAGWAVALWATFIISHTDLFGLRQAWLHLRGKPCPQVPFTQRGLYRRIRHPLMTGFVIVFWAAPTMTPGHLLLAAAATGYILVGIWFEERDLRRILGDTYRDYAARVPALIPGLRPGRGGQA